MPSDALDHLKIIAIAAYKKHSVEKIGYVVYIERRGVSICSNVRKAKAFSELETNKVLNVCRRTCPDFDFLEF